MTYRSQLPPKLCNPNYEWSYWVGDNILQVGNTTPLIINPYGSYTVNFEPTGSHIFIRFKDKSKPESHNNTVITVPIIHATK